MQALTEQIAPEIIAGESAAGEAFLSPEELRLLSAIGFMAAKSGFLVPAIRIFEALLVLRPRAAFPFIGMSIAYTAVGMAGEAVHLLRDRALPVCAEHQELRLWLCVALQQAGSRAAAMKELAASTQGLQPEAWPALARRLSALLGGRPIEPKWPTPAPVVEANGEAAAS